MFRVDLRNHKLPSLSLDPTKDLQFSFASPLSCREIVEYPPPKRSYF